MINTHIYTIQTLKTIEYQPHIDVSRTFIFRYPVEVSSQLRRLRTSMYRARSEGMQLIPESLADYATMLANPSTPRFSLTHDGERFFLGSVTDSQGKVSVVFGSPTFIRLLGNCQELHVDGTFKVRPKTPPSRQLLTMMAIHFGRVSFLKSHIKVIRAPWVQKVGLVNKYFLCMDVWWRMCVFVFFDLSLLILYPKLFFSRKGFHNFNEHFSNYSLNCETFRAKPRYPSIFICFWVTDKMQLWELNWLLFFI